MDKKRRPRLFSLMLTAFALVIVLGIGGMFGFFTLAVADFRSQRNWETAVALAEQPAKAAERLAEYYAGHGSWSGVGQRIVKPPFAAPAVWSEELVYTLVDEQSRVVLTTDPETVVGALWQMSRTHTSVPVVIGDRRVGTLFYHAGPSRPFSPRAVAIESSPWQSRIGQGVLSAGLALAAILLGLAAFFSSRISRPLRGLTGAAHALSAGDMLVRVQRYAIREIDDLGQTFNRMADSLVQADQQRRQLTADVAHELRTPLSIIKGRLEGIQDGVYAASPEQIGDLLDEVALLERLIEDLRLLALADAGQLPLYPETVDPAHLLHDTVSSFAHQAAGRDVALRLAMEEELGEINADPQRILQVLGNLISNALRYTPAGGAVTLRAMIDRYDGQRPQLIIAVEDTGAGIAPADLPHIFDRFWRADRSRTRSSGGAGLGLAIARRIIEAHGGRIWAQSTVGQGTTLSFSLPLEALPEAAALALKG